MGDFSEEKLILFKSVENICLKMVVNSGVPHGKGIDLCWSQEKLGLQASLLKGALFILGSLVLIYLYSRLVFWSELIWSVVS